MKDIEFYLSDLSSTVSAKDQNDILTTVEKSSQIKDCLELSTQLYVMSNLLEVFFSQNYDESFLRYIEDEVVSYINKCDKRMLTSFSMLQQALVCHKDGLFKRIDKDILEQQTRLVEEVVAQLNAVEKSPLCGLLHDGLISSREKTRYYLNHAGDVFVEAS